MWKASAREAQQTPALARLQVKSACESYGAALCNKRWQEVIHLCTALTTERLWCLDAQQG